MSDVYRWQAGEYLMVAGPNGVVLLDPQIGVQLAEKIFEELQRGATLGAILQLLTNAYDLWTIPPFVIALRNAGDLQVVVRGPMHVRISSGEGDDRMSGRGVSTWTERLFERVRSFTVSWTEHVDGPSLPVTGAVLWASSISWGEAEADQPERLTEAARPEPARPSPFAPTAAPAGVATPVAAGVPGEAVHHREPTGIQAPIVRPGPDPDGGSEPTPEPDPEPEHRAQLAAPADDSDDAPDGDEPSVDEPAEDALQQAVSLTKSAVPDEDDPDEEPAADDPPADEDDPGTPEPTAVLPLIPGDPAGDRPRLTGSETLPEVDWEMPPPAPAPEPRPAPAAEAPGTPADLLSGPVWGAPGEDGPKGEEQAAAWAHGGDTMSSPNLGAKLLGRLLGTPADEAEPTVLALLCGDGHPSPPHTSFCSECGQRLMGPPKRVPRPSLGLLTTPDGEVVVLTRSVIVGRSPSAERSSTKDEPRLLTVPSPNQEISRSHVEICLEGWSVLARDLGSSNGTLLVRDGDTPVKLPQTSPLQLQSGDVLDLGEGVRLSLSELP